MSSETVDGRRGVDVDVTLESVRAIARKDFQDAVRSWLFWGLSVFFFTLLTVITGVIWFFAGDPILAEALTTEVLLEVVSQVTRVVLPVIGLVVGWKAIAGEREAGSIKVLLSLPHSRMDVVLGKLLGRSLVLGLSLVVGFALAAVVVAAFMGRFDVGAYLGLLAVSILYGVAYVSIAVAISAVTRSTTIAGVAVFSVFLLFYVVWNAMIWMLQALMSLGHIEGVEYTVEFAGQEVTGERLPDWALFLDVLDPGNAYANALSLVTGVETLEGLSGAPPDLFENGVPFFLQDWFAFVVLLTWIVVPLVVALVRFDRIDL